MSLIYSDGILVTCLKGVFTITTTVWDMHHWRMMWRVCCIAKSNAVLTFLYKLCSLATQFTLEVSGTKALVRIEGMGNDDYGTQNVACYHVMTETGLGTIEEQQGSLVRMRHLE